MDSTTVDAMKFRTIYPNPASDRVMINCAGIAADEINIKITSASGVKVFELRQKRENEQLTIDLTAYPEGLYIIYINEKAYKLIKK
jgi:hypothetical protein